MTDGLHPTTPAEDAERVELIAKVASAFVARAVEAHGDTGVARFSIEVADSRTVSAIAAEIDRSPLHALIGVDPALATDDLPPRLIDQRTAAAWRNLAVTRDEREALVFAVPAASLDTVGETVKALWRLAFDTLAGEPGLWLDRLAELASYKDRERLYLVNLLKGVLDTDRVADLHDFADFVLALNTEAASAPLHLAVARALPALRLPRNGGAFKPLAKAGQVRTAAGWRADLDKTIRATRYKLALRDEKRHAALDRAELEARLEELEAKDAWPLSTEDTAKVRGFVQDDAVTLHGWTETQRSVAKLNWQDWSALFDKGKVKAKESLEDATKGLIEREYCDGPTALSDEERAVLEGLGAEKPGGADADAVSFFERRRADLQRDKAVFKRWERFAFATRDEDDNLLAALAHGVVSLIARGEHEPSTELRVHVRLRGADTLDFWKARNTSLALYLRERFRGLDRLLSPYVTLDFGMCWKRDEWAEELSANPNDSSAVAGRTFPLEFFLLAHDGGDDGVPPDDERLRDPLERLRVDLKLPADSFLQGFAFDLREALAGLPHGKLGQVPPSRGGGGAPISLYKQGSAIDSHGGSDARLLGGPQNPDLHAELQGELRALEAEGALPPEACRRAGEALERFAGLYGRALRGGLDGSAILEQAEAYAALLRTLLDQADNDKGRKRLWAKALGIGVGHGDGQPDVAVVTPFHPLRLVETGLLARCLAGACRLALRANGPDRQALGAFRDELTDAMRERSFPTVVPTRKGKARALAACETLEDYTLHAPPTLDQGADALSPGDAKRVAGLVGAQIEEYLELQPHERSNLIVALYNTGNAELPAELAQRLARLTEDTPDARCELVLTDDEPERLQQVYAHQNALIGREVEGALGSEATKTFLSRLRVGFLSMEDIPDERASKPIDLVVIDDGIARTAAFAWKPRPTKTPSLGDYEPRASTRKLPVGAGDDRSVCLLCPTNLPEPVQAYLDLSRRLFHPDADKGGSWLPAREVVFGDKHVKEMLERAHQRGDWVVTHDALADRRLLEECGFNILRHVTAPASSHNLLVSTADPGKTVWTKLREVVAATADLQGEPLDQAVQAAIDEAAEVSGRVIMRAARRANHAAELLGLVCSKLIAAQAVGEGCRTLGYVMLDDFGRHLGYAGGDVADVLVVGLKDGPNEEQTLTLLAIESKFVGKDNAAAEAKSATAQLLATLNNLSNSLTNRVDGLDRMCRLHRLADLMVEHLRPSSGLSGGELQDLAERVREGEQPLALGGLSAVFVHDGRGEAEVEALDLDGTPAAGVLAHQAVLGRSDVAVLLRRLADAGTGKLSVPLPDPFAAVPGMPEPEPAPPEPEPAPPSPGPEPLPSPQPPEEAERGRLPEALLRALRPTLGQNRDETRELAKDTADRLRRALIGYGMQARLDGEPRLTPNAVLVGFEGSDDLTERKVLAKRGELLTSHGLDVTAVLPGRGRIVVMTARERREVLDLDELMRRRELPAGAPDANASFLLGAREDDGRLLYLNLAASFGGHEQHGPHTLIAGETGSGKGVLTQNLLLDVCATNSPAAARIVLVDPKHGVDYGWLEGMPHLDGGVVTTQDGAIAAFERLVEEMERRGRLLQQARVPNIDRYNNKVGASERLPRLFLFHDELGDWMADASNPGYRDAVESLVVRLASKSRAAGIHLVLITQRPDKDALPGQIKANMNNKICLRVSSGVNSRIVLDEEGAEKLLGRGHFVAKLANERPPSLSSLIHGQAPFADEERMFDLAEALRAHWGVKAAAE